MTHLKNRIPVLACVAAALMLILLTGCGSKKYEDKISSLENDNHRLESEVRDLEEKLRAGSVTSADVGNSLQVLDTGEKEFVTDGGVLTFPTPLGLSDMRDDVNNSNIRIGSRFTLQPTSSWRFNLKGTTLELYHPSGIRGTIKAFTLYDKPSEETVKTAISSFFTGFPKTTITWSNTSMTDRFAGYLANAPTKVDDQDAVLNVGIVFKSDYGLNVMLLTKATADIGADVQQELVDSLLSTISFSDERLKID